MSVPNDPIADALGVNPDRLTWSGFGLPTQITLSWLVSHPGERPFDSDLARLQWLESHGYAYSRVTKDRGTVYFPTLRGNAVYSAGRGL